MAEPTSARPGAGTEVADDEVITGQVVEGEPAGDEPAEQGPVIRDKRRIDPQTGQVRAAYAANEPTESAGAGVDSTPATDRSAEVDAAQALADERLLDLQRLQAEFVNYRRRVERDRAVARDAAIASVMEALLPVLDDVHLARQHGDLETGPFAAIAEKLEATLGRFGLARYGEPGETFDPTVHDALMHTQAELAEGTTETTVVQILQPGYRAGERVLRAARVAVADPQ